MLYGSHFTENKLAEWGFVVGNSVTNRYAKLLYDVSLSLGVEKEISNQIFQLKAYIQILNNYKKLLKMTSLIAQKGFLLIDKIKTELELSNEMVAFLNLLQKNKRLSLLIEICDSYASLVDRIKGKKSVYITYAKKLSKRDETKLVNNIRKIFKGQIECVTKKDESIIGSIKVQYRSKILDYSVKSRLTRLNNAIRKGHYEN